MCLCSCACGVSRTNCNSTAAQRALVRGEGGRGERRRKAICAGRGDFRASLSMWDVRPSGPMHHVLPFLNSPCSPSCTPPAGPASRAARALVLHPLARLPLARPYEGPEGPAASRSGEEGLGGLGGEQVGQQHVIAARCLHALLRSGLSARVVLSPAERGQEGGSSDKSVPVGALKTVRGIFERHCSLQELSAAFPDYGSSTAARIAGGEVVASVMKDGGAAGGSSSVDAFGDTPDGHEPPPPAQLLRRPDVLRCLFSALFHPFRIISSQQREDACFLLAYAVRYCSVAGLGQ